MIDAGAAKIASGVRAGTLRAQDVVDMALARIDQRDGAINSFTAVTHERARKRAQRIDAMVARGEDPGPLAGVPFAAKDLFDIAGITTIAGSKILADRSPAVADAEIISRMENAGGVLVGALNMEELAYGFLTDNAHYGRTCNPHDRERTAGGSSGRSLRWFPSSHDGS